MIFFNKESKSNKKKKNLAGGRGGDGGVARVSVIFFSKESKSEKKCFFKGDEGNRGLASVSEFVLQRIQI